MVMVGKEMAMAGKEAIKTQDVGVEDITTATIIPIIFMESTQITMEFPILTSHLLTQSSTQQRLLLPQQLQLLLQ